MVNSIGERIEQFRERFGLNQGQFSKELNMSQTTISRVESGERKLSKAVLNAMKVYFAANPDWIITGEGEMFISPEEYIDKGIELLGEEKIGSGFVSFLKDPRYKKLQSIIETEKVIDGKVDSELQSLYQQIFQVWNQDDEKTRKALANFVKAYLEEGKNQ